MGFKFKAIDEITLHVITKIFKKIKYRIMKKYISLSFTAIALLFFSNVSFSETLNLGILTSFEAYTVTGAVPNSGGTVTGDIGTHFGIISGFPDPPNTGNLYTANAVTEQAQLDLFRLYIHLNELPVNFPDPFVPGSTEHAAAFGSGETLVPGVYTISGAGSIAATLTLDGGGDPDAFFVIKMNGAMTVAAGATVALTNGTKSANVFWLINGGISVAAGADVKGTLFSKAGAVGLGANVLLEGRMLTMGGEITFGIGSIAGPPPDATTIPIFCESDCIPAPAVDILGVLSDFALFTAVGDVGNTGISGIIGLIGTNSGAITAYTLGTHIGTEEIANALTAQAAADVGAAYTALMAMTSTGTGSAAYLNETILPGVYDIPGAGALGGTVILDAAGDPDAIFVFRFAGAFNVAALSKIILANGAKRCNVFWLGGAGVATGAVNIGAASEMKGYFIANNAASNSGGGVFLAGGQFSNFGEVNTDTAVIYDNPECVTSTALNPNPACGLVKTASIGGTGTGLLGEVITYTFAVTNTGPETLTNVVVTDPLVGLVITGSPIASLPVGVVNTDVTGTYTITQADINAGSVTNSALGTGQDTLANNVTDISGTANDNDTPTVTTLSPTVVTIGQVDLQAMSIDAFLDSLGAGYMDNAALFAMLQAWDTELAASAGAGRDAILAALRQYLDPDGDGQVAVLHWDTLEERGTIGFYVERSDANGEGATFINNDMLPGLINAPMGGEYMLADPVPTSGNVYQYRFIEQEATGNTREYGPYYVEMSK